MSVRTIAGYLALLLIQLACPFARSQDCTAISAKNRSSVVHISVEKTSNRTGAVKIVSATGFVVSPMGFVLTNRHVVAPENAGDTIRISGAIGSQAAYHAPMHYLESSPTDVAMLQFDDTSKKWDPVTIGNPYVVALGQQVCSLGFPLDMEFTMARGAVSGKGAPSGWWYSDMPSNPGESGAPVFDVTGRTVIALKVGDRDDAKQLSLIIPINLAHELLATYAGVDVPHERSVSNTSGTTSDEAAANQCDSFQRYRGDELALARQAERAFAAKNYACAIAYLEQARLVQFSKVWESSYPYLAAAYLLSRQDRNRFESTLQEMLAEMRLNHSYLHSSTTIGFALNNLSAVRQDLTPDAQTYIDETIMPEAERIKRNLGN